MHNGIENGRTLAAVLAEIKHGIRQFVETRVELFKQELHDGAKTFQIAAPLATVGVVLLVTAYLFTTFALAAAVSAFFVHSVYRWFFGFVAIGAVWALTGAVVGYFAKRELELNALAPKRTIEVLKGDKALLESEVRKRA
jgi:uncharacterized membrane protein YqjE